MKKFLSAYLPLNKFFFTSFILFSMIYKKAFKMKNFIFIILSLVLTGCNNDFPEMEKVEETVTISPTDRLEFPLAKAIPVEGGFSIAQQAKNYSVSEIRYLENGVFYVYAPAEGFTGKDVVKIKREDSNGAEVYSETITTLNIKVTE